MGRHNNVTLNAIDTKITMKVQKTKDYGW